jgi:methylase of polypeptide subunit release factors
MYPEYKPVMVTLTFKENITDLKFANKQFINFRKRLNRHLSFNIKYVTVPEFQKRGAVHYHMIILNLPFIDIQMFQHKIWGHGHVDIQKLYQKEGSYNRVYSYIIKYFAKSFADSRQHKAKRYFFALDNHIKVSRNESYAEYITKQLKDTDKFNEYVYSVKDSDGNITNIVQTVEYYVNGWQQISAPIPPSMQNSQSQKNIKNPIVN